MKIKYIVVLLALSFSLSAYSQTQIGSVLAEVEKNNLTLSALKKSLEAKKLENRTGIFLQNPDVEFNYLWGNPSIIGNRTDLNITQTFDFPTAYFHKGKIANLKNEQVEFEYEKERKEVLFGVRVLCYELVYINALYTELLSKKEQAREIAALYKIKLEKGETGVIEYNKAQLNELNVSQELELLNIERKEKLAQLSALNGGVEIEFTQTFFDEVELFLNFEEWYEEVEAISPLLNYLKSEVEQTEAQIKLNRSLSLPKFHSGYMSEKVGGEDFRGVTVGVSIPLWENRNSVKQMKMKHLVAERVVDDYQVQLYHQLQSTYRKIVELQKSLQNYNDLFNQYQNKELLSKALNQGEISLINYLLELSIYYESEKRALTMERDLNIAVAQLYRYL